MSLTVEKKATRIKLNDGEVQGKIKGKGKAVLVLN
jgi:hypothetical protein